MGRLLTLLDEMGLDEMGLDEIGWHLNYEEQRLFPGTHI